MSPFRSRPATRWVVPAAAAILVVGGGAAGTMVANADPTLPARTAEQLLVDLQGAHVDGMSGTVVQRSDLGLPALPNLGGSGAAGTDMTKLLSGTNTLRVWYAGPQKARMALLSTLGESDVIRNGQDVWLWRSSDKTATHYRLPTEPTGSTAEQAHPAPNGMPTTPQQAADAVLKAIDPSTSVTTTGAASVAGRSAYELVLAPKDSASLIGQVRLAIDAEHHIPLRVQVFPRGDGAEAAFRVGFEQVSFTVPDNQQFSFNPPPGSTINEQTLPAESGDRGDARSAADKPGAGKPGAGNAGRSTIVGTGWTSVAVVRLPADTAAAPASPGGAADQLTGVLDKLPKVSGSWGTGRLLTGTLFSALITDDQRLIVGAVAPEKLYEAAAK